MTEDLTDLSEVLRTPTRLASLRSANTGRASPLRSEGVSTLKHRKYVLLCPFGGGLGLFVCVLCIKSGRDFRREFCPLGLGGL